MCVRSPESQTYPGLQQQECGKQIKGYDPTPLLCFGETSQVKYCFQLGSLQYWKDINLLERVYRRATYTIIGIGQLSYKKRMREL